MKRPRPVLILAAAVVLTAGCAAVPNMDHGSSGCQNARGIGPPDGQVADTLKQTLMNQSPADAASIARAAGHTVVFNVQIEGYGECWCVPPPEGEVIQAWFGQRGALWLQVDGVDEGHTAEDQPDSGWGC